MADHEHNNRTLDARPDRVDFRDRIYSPPLVSLPPAFPVEQEIIGFLPNYHETSKILDQGREGACTGFGLAAVINFIEWERWLRASSYDIAAADTPPAHVSPWMLYDNARMYDEWEGEDYSGSSCRGAMKGWHKHGACGELLWPRKTRTNPRPLDGWRNDAAMRPLGAYYRVETKSIGDMQAAIHEVRAVYCAARVHSGWWLKKRPKTTTVGSVEIPVIELDSHETGGHAFAIVGYTCDGFIIQNSWGPDWGAGGFALLTYEDWVRNGDDAWAAAMSAPSKTSIGASVSASRSRTSMQFVTSIVPSSARKSGDGRPVTWTATEAYEHSVVMGNDGKLLRRLTDTRDAQDSLKKVVVDLPQKALLEGRAKHVLLYAHGGLNSESAAIERAMKMGPWFEANDIYPIFIVWRTSLLESIGQIGLDKIKPFLERKADLRSKGLGDLLDDAMSKLQNAFDRSFEEAAEKIVGKAVWSQIKQNAMAAAMGDGGSRQIVKSLLDLWQEVPDLSLHAAGHSAGTILLGHLLGDLNSKNPLKTLSLYAPACSMEFANRHFGRALQSKTVKPNGMFVHNLSDKNERNDTVTLYGKSLLILVSRALDEPRKNPLLGFDKCWHPKTSNLSDLKKILGADYAVEQIKHVRDWEVIRKKHKVTMDVITEPVITTRRPKGALDQTVKSTHGSFDNNIDVVNATVARILGEAGPVKPITDLTSF